MARIGVISDTHGVLPVEAFNALADCEHIIHAGDICSPEIICDLQTLAPVTAVLGNNDFNEYGSSVRRFARPVVDGVRFLVAHYPRDVRFTFAGSGALAPGDPLPNVCIHGHTHIPEIVVGKEARPADLLLCPGSPTNPRGGFPQCVAKIDVWEGRILRAWVERTTHGPHCGEVVLRRDFA